MKLLFLGDASSIHFARWAHYFAQRGHEVFTSSAEPPKEELPNFKRLAGPIKWQPLRYLALKGQVRQMITELKPDLVNAHFVPNYGLLGALSGFHPLVISTWGSDVLISPHKSFLHKARAAYALSKADLVTTDAKISLVAVVRLGVKSEKVLMTPMGVPAAFLESGRKKTLEKKEMVTIFSCRRLEKLYNVETLLLALARLKTGRPWQAFILGEGSQKRKLEKLAQRLKLGYKVSFMGALPVSYYQELLLKSDIYVSTALSDSTSVSLLEAMAAKLACIVTEIPGNSEWIKVMENGLTFVRRGEKMLAYLIEQLVDDNDLRIKLAEKAFEEVETKAVWEENMAEVEKAFLKLVDKG